MRHLSSQPFHSIAFFVVVILSFTTAAQSSSTAQIRPEIQLSSQEVEKFLEGLTRYLHRQRLEQVLQHQQQQQHQQQHQQKEQEQEQEPMQQQASSEENYDPDENNNSLEMPMALIRKMPTSSSSLSSEEERLLLSSEPASHFMTQSRPAIVGRGAAAAAGGGVGVGGLSTGKWPYSLADQEGLDNVKQRPTYGKRNSELINSLLGLPRFMKVVG